MTKKNVNLKTDSSYDYQSLDGLEYYKKFEEVLYDLDDDLEDDKRFNLAFEEEEEEKYEEYLNKKLEDDLFDYFFDIIVDPFFNFNVWQVILKYHENYSNRLYIGYCICENYEIDDFEYYCENDFENDLIYECIAEYLDGNL
ncbi:MAG: hypothetical protein ACOYO1_20075 [Bacteroidales bacterium]